MVQYEAGVARTRSEAEIDEGLRSHMMAVYMIMAVGMIVTAIFSYAIGMDLRALNAGQETLLFPRELLDTMYKSWIRWVLVFAPLGVVFLLYARINSMSAASAQATFYFYAALVGVSIATIFAAFTLGSIFQTFLATAVAFLGLSIYGYTTKRDLSGMGTFLMMGVIGLVVAMIINIFLQSSVFSMIISAVGVLIFAALTAYDTQEIKNQYLDAARAGPAGEAVLEKGAIIGALHLYLNFLNMFMFLLQFMGASED